MMAGYYDAKKYDARRSIGYLVRRISSLMTSDIELLFTGADLTFIQYVILMNLRDGLATTCAQLCQGLRYDSGAITRVVDQLEERKLIKRQRSTRDRRVVKLSLTPLGKSTVETALPLVVQRYNEWLDGFTKEEADTLIQLMTKLNTRICDPSSCRKG